MSEKMISEESSAEEVADYLSKNKKISDDVKKNFIKEGITGDILFDLSDNEFKLLGLKLGPIKKLRKFLDDNKDKFKEKEYKENITIISKPEEVKQFFDKCLNFKENLDNLDGKKLLELNDEGMVKLGLNLGQRKRSLKYIEYFKTLKVEIPQEEEEPILVTKKSNEEEVANFLKLKLKFSQDSIDALGLDGESLFMLEETDIQELTELKEEEKNNLIKFLNDSKLDNKKENESELVITNKSTDEEVAKFLKIKLGFKDESIEELSLDGESLFLLQDTDIDELKEISQEERDKLKNFLNEEKNKNKENLIIEEDVKIEQNPKNKDDIQIEEKPKNEEISKPKENSEVKESIQISQSNHNKIKEEPKIEGNSGIIEQAKIEKKVEKQEEPKNEIRFVKEERQEKEENEEIPKKEENSKIDDKKYVNSNVINETPRLLEDKKQENKDIPKNKENSKIDDKKYVNNNEINETPRLLEDKKQENKKRIKNNRRK